MKLASVGVGALPRDTRRVSRVNQDHEEYVYFKVGPNGVPDPDISDIRDQHAAEVLAATERLGTDDPERISEYLYLHLSIVRRHLGYDRPRAKTPTRVELVVEYLRKHGPATLRDIAAGLGKVTRCDGGLGQVLVGSPRLFRKAGMKPTSGGPAYIWALAEGV